MKPIIDAIDRSLLKQELTPGKFLRPTNKANNEIYIITAHDSPNVMREIGRLRELSFRTGGGGTGEEIDTDKYDFMANPYKQLIVWDPEAEQIIGGYRFLPGNEVNLDENGQPEFVMSHLFIFSERFIREYMPYTIELGRAFVQPDYQTTKMGMKSLFALDNLWDGLGALIHSTKNTKYFVGKVNIYPNYPIRARDLIYEYLKKHFPDPDRLITPKKIISVSEENQIFARGIFTEENAVDDYKLLNKAVRHEGQNIPPMFNAYIGLSDTMRVFGSMQDHDFGSTYETGIMVVMNDLHENKKQRYIQPYIEYLRKLMEEKLAVRKENKARRQQARQEKREQKGKKPIERKRRKKTD